MNKMGRRGFGPRLFTYMRFFTLQQGKRAGKIKDPDALSVGKKKAENVLK